MKLIYTLIIIFVLLSMKTAVSQDKDSTELIIRKMRYYPIQEIFNNEEFLKIPVKYWVLKIHFKTSDKIPQQSIVIVRDSINWMYQFEPYKSFDTEEEVLEFAKLNQVTDIDFDENKIQLGWKYKE